MPYIGSAPPTTYSVNDEQFIIIHATGGWSLKSGYGKLVDTGDTIIGFKLKNQLQEKRYIYKTIIKNIIKIIR